MKRKATGDKGSQFSHLYRTATTTAPAPSKDQPEREGPKKRPSGKFASPSVPRDPNQGKTRADYQKIDGISYYKQVCLFVLLEGHVNQGVSHQAIFDTEKQEL